MNKVILLIGAPGAGKGTQARLLQERLGLPQISTGDIFRALSKADTALARLVKPILAAGQLVPDELTIRVVEERTSQDDCRDGYILDGFPRTAEQAESLEDLAKAQGKTLQAILIDVSLDILEKRLTGRRSCPICKEIYNVYYMPPKKDNVCDLHSEVQLEQREDDKPEKVRPRLEVYESQTAPLLDYYGKTNRLQSVDGLQEPETVYENLEKLVRVE